MISVIVCSRQDHEKSIHEKNVSRTIGSAFEYIRIDNRDNRYSLCSAYNDGVRRAKGDILVFVHEDVFFMEANWGLALEKKFLDQTIGLVGVAGTQYLFKDVPGWVAAGRPFIHGQVVHEINNGDVYNLTVFSWENKDTDVVAVDGLFFAIRKDLFTKISFDEHTFDGFHFYDLDICMQINKTHRLIVTWDVLLKHQSGGSFDSVWKMYAAKFLAKYSDILPVSCSNSIPDLAARIPFENYDLKGKVPQITIA